MIQAARAIGHTHRFHCALIAAVGLLSAPVDLASAGPAADVATQLSERLFHNVDDFWSQQVASLGGRYRPPHLAFFAASIRGVCDVPMALAGPFYCPVNETVYLDRLYLTMLLQRARDAATFAVGYVVAHEVAHHIQNLIGTTSLVDAARSRSTPELAERTLTTMELQADCYAGLWAHWGQTHGQIKPSADSSAMLDTVLASSQQRRGQLAAGQEMLDPLTHGDAAQRLKWFRRGFDSGRFGDCDTFGAEAAGTL